MVINPETLEKTKHLVEIIEHWVLYKEIFLVIGGSWVLLRKAVSNYIRMDLERWEAYITGKEETEMTRFETLALISLIISLIRILL